MTAICEKPTSHFAFVLAVFLGSLAFEWIEGGGGGGLPKEGSRIPNYNGMECLF
jgi:hypothetical protein